MKNFSIAICKVISLSIFFFFVSTHSAALAFGSSKIILSPQTVTLQENRAVEQFQVNLDAPIMTAQDEDSGFVTLTLTSSDPRVSITPSTITYSSREWSETKVFTVTTTGDGIVDLNNLVTISFSVSTNTVYYSGVTGYSLVTLIDDDRQAPVLTETNPIPRQVATANAVYYFSTSGDRTGYTVSSDCPAGTLFNIVAGTVTFPNLTIGQTYGGCSFHLGLDYYPDSNTLNIGSFTEIAPPSPTAYVSGGGRPVHICTDPKASNYQASFGESDPSVCNYGPGTAPVQTASPTSVPPVALFIKPLSLGMKDPEVLLLQKYLSTKGFPVTLPGKETNYFGARTKKELELFQKSAGLAVSGALDAGTIRYIN